MAEETLAEKLKRIKSKISEEQGKEFDYLVNDIITKHLKANQEIKNMIVAFHLKHCWHPDEESRSKCLRVLGKDIVHILKARI